MCTRSRVAPLVRTRPQMDSTVTLRCAFGVTVAASASVLSMASRVFASILAEADLATPNVFAVDDFDEQTVRLFVDLAGLMSFASKPMDLSVDWLCEHLGTARQLVVLAHKYDASGVMQYVEHIVASWSHSPDYLSNTTYSFLPITQVAIDCLCSDPDYTGWLTDNIKKGIGMVLTGRPRRCNPKRYVWSQTSVEYDELPHSVRTEVLLWVVTQAELTPAKLAQDMKIPPWCRAADLVFPK